MQIDWVNVLATVTVGSVVVSAISGAGSLLAYKIMQLREARAAEVVVPKKGK
jgi:hypothetical protein